MKKRNLVVAFTMLFLILVLTATASADWRDYDRDPDPDVLTYAIIATEDIAHHVQRYEGLLNWIEEVTGKETEWYITTSYASLIEAMRTGTIDIGSYGPTSAVMAIDQAGAEVIAIRVDNDTGEQGYFTYMTARYDSGIEEYPEDLEGNLVSFTDPASTSGHVAVRYDLEVNRGITPEDYFEDIVWTGSHEASQLAVKEGRVDAGATASTVYWRMVDRGDIDPDEVVIIWQSDLIPLGPLTIRTDLNEELKEQIKEAAYTFADQPEYASTWLEEMNTSGFEPASNEDFDIIRGMEEEVDID